MREDQADVDEYHRLNKAIEDALAVLDEHKARLLAFQQRISPVATGDIVRDSRGEEGLVVRCRVHNIYPHREGWGRPTIDVVKRKKDGTWGVRHLNVWGGWTLVSKASEVDNG